MRRGAGGAVTIPGTCGQRHSWWEYCRWIRRPCARTWTSMSVDASGQETGGTLPHRRRSVSPSCADLGPRRRWEVWHSHGGRVVYSLSCWPIDARTVDASLSGVQTTTASRVRHAPCLRACYVNASRCAACAARLGLASRGLWVFLSPALRRYLIIGTSSPSPGTVM